MDGGHLVKQPGQILPDGRRRRAEFLLGFLAYAPDGFQLRRGGGSEQSFGAQAARARLRCLASPALCARVMADARAWRARGG
jgi:hypothetical protein